MQYNLKYLKISRKNIQNFSRKCVFHPKKFGNVWMLIRRFSLARQRRTNWHLICRRAAWTGEGERERVKTGGWSRGSSAAAAARRFTEFRGSQRGGLRIGNSLIGSGSGARHRKLPLRYWPPVPKRTRGITEDQRTKRNSAGSKKSAKFKIKMVSVRKTKKIPGFRTNSLCFPCFSR